MCIYNSVYICKNIFFKIYVPFHYFLGCLLLWQGGKEGRWGWEGSLVPLWAMRSGDGYHLQGIGVGGNWTTLCPDTSVTRLIPLTGLVDDKPGRKNTSIHPSTRATAHCGPGTSVSQLPLDQLSQARHVLDQTLPPAHLRPQSRDRRARGWGWS